MPTEIDNSTQRISFWKDFRKTSLQQFNRCGGNPERDVILVLDPRDDFAVHLAKVSYRAAIKEPHADPKPNEELGTLAIIGAPFILVLPYASAKAALDGLFPKAVESLTVLPDPGKVRVAILQDVGTGPGCTVITDGLLLTKKRAN